MIPIVIVLLLIFASPSWGADPVAAFTTSRTSCVAPCGIFFDASDSSDADLATNRAFHDLTYYWHFGEQGLANWPDRQGGYSKGVALGSVVSHLFETAGAFVVNLTVEDEQGNTDDFHQLISITDPAVQWSGTNTYCFSTSGTFTGCPAGATEETQTDYGTALGNCLASASNRCLFRGGETFTKASVYDTARAGPILIGSFGTGRATLDYTGTGGDFNFEIQHNDWRFSKLTLDGGNATNPSGGMFRVMDTISNLLLHDTVMTANTYQRGALFDSGILDPNSDTLHDGIYIFDNNWQDLDSIENLIFGLGQKVAIVGNTLRDAEAGEHVIRGEQWDGAFICNNDLGGQADGKHVLTIRNLDNNGACSYGCGIPTRKVVVCDNYVASRDDWAIQAVVTANDASFVPQGEDVIIERNYITRWTDTADNGVQVGIYTLNTDRMTVRNNICRTEGWGFPSCTVMKSATTNGSSTVSEMRAYNNTSFNPDTTSQAQYTVNFIDGTPPAGWECYNNLLWDPNATGTESACRNPPTAAGDNLVDTANPFATASPGNDPNHYKLDPNDPGTVDQGTTGQPVWADYFVGDRSTADALPDIGAHEATATLANPLASPAGHGIKLDGVKVSEATP